MGKNFTDAVLAIITGVIGLATLSVIMSKNAQTTSVIQSATSGLASILSTVISPITSSSSNNN